LDTRTKIVPRQRVEALSGAVWVAGHFDPLLAEHVRWLERERKQKALLVVEVTNPVQPLLAQRARAELVASLGFVDFVVLGGEQAAADSPITERFMEHVLNRHRQESHK
jgi:glycerol-3-phosphate cytidylyltransferase-like family protein